MKAGCIYSIEITTNTNEIFSVSSDYFDHFYIANINDDGDEKKYKKNNQNLIANFFMVRILSEQETVSCINKLVKKNDIIKVTIYFTNGSSQDFDIPKKRVAQNKQLVNLYEETFTDDSGLCILITDKKIRYKKNLFA
ncbi:MAG: hypothetical protein OSJ70_02980 [Bacilli bacterium]|nr:hypothetical protein [Bacilli bacterium]